LTRPTVSNIMMAAVVARDWRSVRLRSGKNDRAENPLVEGKEII